MRNSWGQEINVGDVVYRGARRGNSSEYKVGVVQSLNPGKNPRVKWVFQSSVKWIHVDGDYVTTPSIYKPISSGASSPSLESLIVVDFDLEQLAVRAKFFSEIDKDFNFRSWEEFYQAMESYHA